MATPERAMHNFQVGKAVFPKLLVLHILTNFVKLWLYENGHKIMEYRAMRFGGLRENGDAV